MTNYLVAFEIINTPKTFKPRTQKVTLTEGYSDFEDIRKILSIPLGLKPENISVQALQIVK